MPHIFNDRRLRAFTLVELLTVLAIVGILAAILIPTVSKMRASARAAQCGSNMREIGNAMMLYAHDHNAYLPAVGRSATDPSGYFWTIVLHPYTGTQFPYKDGTPDVEKINTIFICPEWARVKGTAALGFPALGYAMIERTDYEPTVPFGKATPLAEFKEPSRALLLVEHDDYHMRADYAPYALAPTETGALRHESKAHYLFADLHVRGMTPQDAKMYIPPAQ